jgi:hypothetical protein
VRTASAWAQIMTPRGLVCAVRVHTTPLVELRLRWDYSNASGRTVTTHRVIAERLTAHASSCRSGALAGSHLTAHVNQHRFGIAASCWRSDWTHMLRAVLAHLAEDRITNHQAANIGRRVMSGMLHSRNGLDTAADHECLRKLLGTTRLSGADDAATPHTDASATEVSDAQHRLRATPALLLLVGDLEPEPTAELAASMFDHVDMEASSVPEVRHEPAEPARPVWNTTTWGDRTACRLAAVVPSLPPTERVVADVVAHLLGDPITGLVTNRLRNELGCSYDVRCQIDDLGPSRVLMCKAVVAAVDAHRAGAEMREIAGAGVAKHIQIPGTVEEARTAVAASRLLVGAHPSGWASELVKALAAGVHPSDALGVIEQIRSVSASEVAVFVTRHLVDAGERGDRR